MKHRAPPTPEPVDLWRVLPDHVASALDSFSIEGWSRRDALTLTVGPLLARFLDAVMEGVIVSLAGGDHDGA